MYRRILLCYDGTAEGRRALREGAEIATATRAEVCLLAICRSLVAGATPDGANAMLVECEDGTARTLLEDGVARLRARGLDAHGELAVGNPLERIPAAARRLGADLVVLAHRRRGRLARWWTDSPEQSLLDLLSCSILVSTGGRSGPDE